MGVRECGSAGVGECESVWVCEGVGEESCLDVAVARLVVHEVRLVQQLQEPVFRPLSASVLSFPTQ